MSSNLHSPSVIGITSSVTNFPKAMPGNTCYIATTTGVHSTTLTDHRRCPTTTATAPHTMFAALRHQKNGQPMLTASPLDHHTMTRNPHALGQKTPLSKNGPLTLSVPRRKRLSYHRYPPCGETPLTDHMLALGAHEHSRGKTIGRHTLRPMTMLEGKRCIPVPIVCAPSTEDTVTTSMHTKAAPSDLSTPWLSTIGVVAVCSLSPVVLCSPESTFFYRSVSLDPTSIVPSAQLIAGFALLSQGRPNTTSFGPNSVTKNSHHSSTSLIQSRRQTKRAMFPTLFLKLLIL